MKSIIMRTKYTKGIPKSVYFYKLSDGWWAGPFVKPQKGHECVEYHLVPINEESVTGNFSPETERAIKTLNNKGKALLKQINESLKVTELPHLEVSNTDMMALIDTAYLNINTVVRNLERITGEEMKKWIKEMLIKEIGKKIDVICDDSNNPPSVLDYNVLIAYVFYKLNNTVIERELIFGKTKDIIQFKADLLV
jgi:hypothetical protein